jgi:hypothetical protein
MSPGRLAPVYAKRLCSLGISGEPASVPDGHLLGSYQMAIAREPNSRVLDTTCFLAVSILTELAFDPIALGQSPVQAFELISCSGTAIRQPSQCRAADYS